MKNGVAESVASDPHDTSPQYEDVEYLVEKFSYEVCTYKSYGSIGIEQISRKNEDSWKLECLF